MKKFFIAFMVLSIFILPTKVFAEDIWISTEYDREGNKYDRYVITENINEDLEQNFFTVPIKLVVNGNLAETRTHIFCFVIKNWYARQNDTEGDLTFVNGNEFYKKIFDACKRYSQLAQIHPR